MPPEYVLMWLPAGAIGLLSVLAVVNWIGVKVKAVLTWAGRWAERVRRVFLDWEGEPGDEGHEPRPGVMARLRSYDEKIDGLTGGLSSFLQTQEVHSAQLDFNQHAISVASRESARAAEETARNAAAIAAVATTVEEIKATSATAHEQVMHEMRFLSEQFRELMTATADSVLDIRRLDRAIKHHHPQYDPDDYSD